MTDPKLPDRQPPDLSKIAGKDKPSTEAESFEEKLEVAHINEMKSREKEWEEIRKLRVKFSNRTYYYLVGWTIGVFLIVILQGFECIAFDLPDTALSVLLGSTTASAIGLVGFIVKGLFSNIKKSPLEIPEWYNRPKARIISAEELTGKPLAKRTDTFDD